MNQVKPYRGNHSRAFRAIQTGGSGACWCACLLLTLAGCDPSPASRALKAGPAVVNESPEIQAPNALEQPDATPQNGPIAEVPASPEAAEDDAVEVEVHPTGKPEVGKNRQADTPGEQGDGLKLLGKTVAPGTSERLMWSASQIFEGISSETPVLVVNGYRNGPTLCLTAAIHGDELNGIEMVRQVLHELDPKKVKGAVIGIPIVNLQGFRRGSRYLPDRRDLNRYFPGNPMGSSAARIANSLFEEIIRECDALVDLHTGSFYRTNLPQLRADLRYSKIKNLTQGFGGMVVLHSVAAPGTLRRAATDSGIPAITLEAGEPLRLQSNKVSQGVTGIFTLLDTMEIINRIQLLAPPEPVFYESTWVRADHGGILFTVVRLGQAVEPGDVLGTVTDPITNERNLIYSPAKGRILGMALNQVVMPGFASFRIGIETDGPPANALLASMDWETEFDEKEPVAGEVGTRESVDEYDPQSNMDLEETSE